MSETFTFLINRDARRQALKKFLFEMVISEEFDSEDYETLSNNMAHSTDEVAEFADWFGLGQWFEDEVEALEFDLDDVMVELDAITTERDREASDEYREMQRDYRSLVGGNT